jgi:hypothetical protein
VLVSLLGSVATGMSAFSGDLRAGPLAERLEANVPNGPLEMPVLIGQGDSDTLITPDVVAAHADRLCAAGAAVDYRTYAGRDHVGVVQADSPLIGDLVAWTRARFAGDRPSDTCFRLSHGGRPGTPTTGNRRDRPVPSAR